MRKSTPRPTGSIYPRTGRPPDLEPPPTMTLKPRFRVWVEGEALVESYDNAQRLDMDKAEVLLKKLGFLVHRQPIGDDDELPKRRRLTERRVPLTELHAYLLGKPAGVGTSLADVIETYYRVEPWNDLSKEISSHKARQSLSRLCKQGLAKRVYDPDGGKLFVGVRAP